ncbi:MAG: multicopper oxidase domain-containing protein, partial [Pseudonocardiaceae bacterium]
MSALSRRGLFGVAGGIAAIAGLAGCGIGLAGQTGELLRSRAPRPAPFRVPLPIPPVRRPVDGVVEITQRVADVEILPGLRTPVLGYDGIFPGPTVETHRGEPVLVRHRNELPVPTVVHLHGGHTPPEHDGWPTDLVLPSGWRHHSAHGGDISYGERSYAYPM